MKKNTAKILSILVLLILVGTNYLFLSQYFIFKQQGPAMMYTAIVSDLYNVDGFIQREDGTYQNLGESSLFDSDDEAMINHASNPDLDEDGTLTIREANVYQILGQLSNIEAAGGNIAGNVVQLLGYIIIMIDAIGLGFVLMPWLKK